MDAVYICRPGPNEELRYSLRSLRNLGDLEQVWIFGDWPAWVNPETTGLVRVPKNGGKFDIGRNNLTAACEHPDVSDPFVLMNDDFHITAPIPTVPILNRGTVLDVITEYQAAGINSAYVKSMMQTRDVLQQHGHDDPLSFELHTPIPVTKTGMLEAFRIGGAVRRWNNRTAYGAVAGVTGQRHEDVKIYHPTDTIPTGPFLSTSDISIRWVAAHLEGLFPDTSPHERA